MCGFRGRGDRGSEPPPPKNQTNVEFLSNTGPDTLEIIKVQKRFANGPL